jgi:L-methionine (R)-S-oxide reductase
MDNFMPVVNENHLLAMVDDFIQTASSRYSALEAVVRLLASNYKHFNWAGVYVLEDGLLQLGPYFGDPSPHVSIPIGEGICGAAVREGKTIVVPDVNADNRYLACSISTKSEIVVPICKDGNIVGEIDIDSDNPDAFTDHDRFILEEVAVRLGQLF